MRAAFVMMAALMSGVAPAVAQTAQEDVTVVRVVPATGAMLRGLDKISGEVVDFELALDDSFAVGPLEVFLRECRHPEDNISGEAYAWIDIANPERKEELFSGWMIASSPALNALDHPRYDVWVIRCTAA